jgi:hypothetical protein
VVEKFVIPHFSQGNDGLLPVSLFKDSPSQAPSLRAGEEPMA